MLRKLFNNKFWLPITIVCLLFLNWAASQFHTRVDLTNEKRFTLSNATKKLLKKIEEPVTVDVFLKGNYPSGFRQLSSSTNDILKEFKEVAGNKIRYNFIGPDELMPGTEIAFADTLSGMGLYPINLTSQLKEGQQQQFVYPFALVHYQEKILPVELYKGKTPLINFTELNSAEALLEYRLAGAIAKITEKEKPIIGYAVGNGEPEIGRFNTYDLVENVLKPNYNLFTFDLNAATFLPKEMTVLLIVKPTVSFTDEQKLKLDQYVMNGGKLLIFADRLNAEMDSLQIKNQVTAFDRDLKWNDLFFNYGVRINADLLMDLQCDYLPFDVNGNGQFELLPWNYFPVMESKSNHPINKGLGFVAGRFVNSLDTVEADAIKKTVLLSSSANARTLGSPAVISGAENINAPEDAKYKRSNIPVAVLLEGKFKSMFANRLSQAMSDSLQSNNASFLPQNIVENKMIVVGDGDIILNSVVKGNPIPMGMNVYTYDTQAQVPFANKEFLQNCLDYLINENGLSEAKAKDYVVRLLDNKKTAEQKIFWQVMNIAVPIIIVLLFAFIFQWLRKRKYTK
ncbi:MAG: gliding motility-associated ABC transporter substrate-binding protein GldG [Ferruginibacter sp.]|nr:gliding motility-associated ABC transporter substrate-binding protein GldG [Ferruginibacter sp.]